MISSLKVLADPENHANLLLAEAAAWLHDFWKCTDEHIEQKASNRAVEESDAYETEYLSLLGSHQITILREQPVSLKTLVKDYGLYKIDDTNGTWLLRTLRRCHDVAHTEKEDVYHLAKQTVADTRRSSSFGYESEPLTSLTKRLCNLPFDKTIDRSKFKPAVEEAFSYAIGDTQRPINEVTLWDWSSIVAALYKAAIAAALLGDRREPPDMRWRLLSVRLNGAAFLERVARVPDLLVRQKLIADGLDNVRKLLEVIYPVGTEVYRDENGSVFIVPDIENLLQLENEQGEKLCDLIKNKFSTGTIYRKSSDGTIYKEESLQLDGEVVPFLEFDKEPWHREESRRHQKPLPIAGHVKEIPASHADPHRMKQWWQGYKEDICTVCQVRPQGWGALDYTAHTSHLAKGEKYVPSCQICKALERRVCVICERRREDRSEEWATEKLHKTIWIDEIADGHGRIALVVGKFDLKHWLDGQMLFYPGKSSPQIALRVKNLGDALREGQLLEINRINYTWHEAIGVFLSEKDARINRFPQHLKVRSLSVGSRGEDIIVKDVHRLLDGRYRIELDKVIPGVAVGGNCSIWGKNFQVVGDGSEVETASDEAVKLVQDQFLYPGHLIVEQSFEVHSMVETQTPARLHRVWETTRTFWEEVVERFGERKIVGKVAARLKIYIENQGFLVPSHTYELKMDNANLSIVCTNRNEVVTVDNLRRTVLLLGASQEQYKDEFVAAEHIKGVLEKKKAFDVEEPTGYGSPNKVLGKLRITRVEVDTTPYTPAIEILSEPQTFMALVPADKALNVANALKEKYEREMGKVQNRLPMTMGIVFAGSRTPLPAILDAGRRMLRQPIDSEEWVIDDVDKSKRPEIITLKVRCGAQSLTLNVPTIMGDKRTEDVWYPYLRLEKSADHVEKPERLFKLNIGESSEYWVHVSDLQIGDIVSFMPSRFDFEFLDTASRRFEISYHDGKRRHTVHPARPYYLEQVHELAKLWEILDNGLATSQIHNLVGLIETKRVEWKELISNNNPAFKETFEKIVCEIIANAGWARRPEKDCLEWLVQAAISGQLADVVELYMSILDKDDNRQEGGNK